MAGMIYINGKEFPAPDRGLGFTVSTNVSDGRNALGEFVGQRVGRDQYKIDGMQWTFLDAATWAAILQEFSQFVVVVKFPDMVRNDWITLRMYPGNRTAVPWEIDPNTMLPTVYADCKVNIIDCGEVD